MFGQNWNGVVNEGNPAVYLGLKSWVGHISDTTSASSYPLEPLIAWDRDWIVKYKTFFLEIHHGNRNRDDDHNHDDDDDQCHFRDD